VRFGLVNGATVGELTSRQALAPADRWILSRLNATVVEVDAFYEDFQFAKATDALFHFAWDEVFDWYVELAKTSFSAGGARADATRAVLGHVLDVLMRLLHPVIPFVTEQLWTVLTGGESLVVAGWPKVDDALVDPDAEAGLARVQDVITEVRRFRAEQGLRPRQKVGAVLVTDDALLTDYATEVGTLTDLTLEEQTALPDGWQVLTVGASRIALDLAGAIDVAAERARLNKDLDAARKDKDVADKKLNNPEFVGKAPDNVVSKVRDRLTAAEADIARITGQLEALPSG
jgi:valyl-tRNA synthetase